MDVTAWSNGKGTFGIRVGAANRDNYFSRHVACIEVDIEGYFHTFKLTPGFWNKCPEFRDSGSSVIQDWLRRHYTTDWPSGRPPRFHLHPLSATRFRLGQ
jgi:hypothetical protein